MSEWREVAVEALCSRVTSGGTPSRKRADYYADEGIPWVKSQELVGARITATEEHISEAGLKRSSAKLLPRDTVLLAMYGANVGQLGWLGVEATVNQAICAMVTDPNETDSRFLYYALAGARERLVGNAHGAAQQNLSQQLIKPFKLAVPALATQQRIGEILRSIDDLIENNRRRVEVLEEMARSMYREWFVKFRYPGHEDVPMVDSALGPIPEGWCTRPVRELAAVVVRGISPRYADDGEWIVLNQKCIRNRRVSFGPSRRQERPVSDVKRIRSGDVLINSTGVGTLGRVAMYRGPSEGVTVDSHVTICRPVDDSIHIWFAMSMLAQQDEIERLGTGATGQIELRKTVVEALELVQPVEAVVDAFGAIAWPILNKIDVLLATNEHLSALRDRLLPKLVTGQIDVSSLDLDAVVAEQVT
ncbi:restriction endonuclease subunit S [Corynebacterium variabile]|uniref:restriction endonuclease subunit S n=1 Tax=Corynebacterium variabile TaxID=1727 RepID=UPI0028AFEAF7|nr:restriction endonuclease subunit S [Corynebacterium variabile]